MVFNQTDVLTWAKNNQLQTRFFTLCLHIV